MNRFWCFAILIIVSFTACKSSKNITKQSKQNRQVNYQGIKVSAGSIDFIENFKSKYVDARNIRIWLPENFDRTKQYPVLYIHDAQMLFDASSTWNKQEWGVDEVLTQLIEEKKVPACIVVGIDNNNAFRHTEYFPQKAFEALSIENQTQLLNDAQRSDQKPIFAGAIQSDNYLKMLVEELKPYIDKTYPTKPSKANTFIAGSSMGGLISMYAMCEYPNVFGAAACISTHWIGTFETENNPIPAAFNNYIKENIAPTTANQKWYFDYGTESLDKHYEPFQNDVDEILKDKGFTEKNWLTKKFEGHNHSEKSWNKRLDGIFEFIMN